jgi:prepilin-type processing-associated H-X9-DG protein
MSQESPITCPACGSQQPAGSAFCSKCGNPLTQPAPVTPPPYPPAYHSGQYQPPPYATAQPYGEPPKTSGWAIASLVCGILFCIPLSALLAIVFGIVGIVETKGGRKKGFGMALAGLILGLLVGPVVLIAILLPSLNRARETANRVKCASNMRQIGQAMLLYANDNMGKYPPDLPTLLKNEDIAASIFLCPSSGETAANGPADLESGGHDSYVYLGKGLTESSDQNLPTLYEVDAHHIDGANFLFVDGHVEFIPKSQEAAILSRRNNPPPQ